MTDINDALDRRNELLSGIKSNTSKTIEILKDIKSDTSALPEIKTILGSFVIEQREHNKEQREHNQWMKDHLIKMDEHNQHLEKILEKLDAPK